MKKFLSLGLAAVLTAGLATSCKDDVLTSGEDIANAGAIQDDGIRMYFKAGIALPSAGTRSQTEGDEEKPWEGDDKNNQTNSNVDKSKDEEGNDLPDYEYGHDYENNIRAVLLVFTNKDREFVTYSYVTGITKNPNMQGEGENATRPFDVEVLGEIKHTDLEKAYKTGDNPILSGNNPIVYVYAFCNPTARMIERFANLSNGTSKEKEKWYNWEGIVEEEASAAGFTPLTQNSIWAEDTFLMSSAKECEVTFPTSLDEWDKYADKSNPFRIGFNEGVTGGDNVLDPILVERVAARIDFKDGSTKWSKFKGDEPNTYPIFVDSNGNNQIDTDGTDLNIISVQLNRMCLVNMSKNYYYLRRVAKEPNSKVVTPSFTGLLGVEHNNNYVGDYDWDIKNFEDGMSVENEHKYFNFPLYTTDPVDEDETDDTSVKYNRFGWYTDRIVEDFLENDNTKDETWKGNGGYKIWRYVTENTLPSEATQTTVQSTGIVFKGRIVTGKDITESDAKKYMSENVINAIQYINGEEIEVPDGETKKKVKFDREDAKTHTSLSDEQKQYAPYLYSFLNILYAGEEETIQKANEDGSNGSLNQAVNHVLNNWVLVEKDGKYTYTFDRDGEITKSIEAKIAALTEGGDPVMDDRFTVAKWARINAALIDPSNNDGPQKIPVRFAKKVNNEIVYETQEKLCEYVIEENDFANVAASGQLTVYRPYNEKEQDVNGKEIGDGWGYYCYYFYWNRHNDNGLSGKMGNMEFATVRNNVYKLYVESIGALGHPRHRSFDPDPVDPTDPDEDPLNYIQVRVQVLPWVVRENKITF